MRTGRTNAGRFVLVGVLGTLAALWAASCQGPQEFFRDSGIVNEGTGGIVSTGGQGASTSTGGASGGTGGTIVIGTGGSGTGGTPATGGKGGSGTGGLATGGVTGTGGKATGGVTGTGGVATGGVTGTGGVATGGITGTGGLTGTGGVTGTGGTATGGTTGAAGSTGTAANCVDAIKMAGYSSGGQMCSTCKENSQDKSAACEAVIDCLDMKYPCGSANNCSLECNNSGGADSVVTGCVSAILGTCATP